MGDRDVNFKAGCCSISEVVRKPDVRANSIFGAYKAVTLAGGAHLKQGSNREWGFEHVEVDKGRVRYHLHFQQFFISAKLFGRS